MTLLAIAVALTAASLFYQGSFLPAVLFAWAATVLDGVDGKLARVKLMVATSLGKLGRIARNDRDCGCERECMRKAKSESHFVPSSFQ